MKRVKRVADDPNPLFRLWLEEFRKEARTKDNTALVRLYTQCIDSLGDYLLGPLQLPQAAFSIRSGVLFVQHWLQGRPSHWLIFW